MACEAARDEQPEVTEEASSSSAPRCCEKEKAAGWKATFPGEAGCASAAGAAAASSPADGKEKSGAALASASVRIAWIANLTASRSAVSAVSSSASSVNDFTSSSECSVSSLDTAWRNSSTGRVRHWKSSSSKDGKTIDSAGGASASSRRAVSARRPGTVGCDAGGAGGSASCS